MLARRKAEISQHHKVACRLEPVAEIDQLFERPVRVHIHSQTLEENVLALRLIFEADSRELDLRLFGEQPHQVGRFGVDQTSRRHVVALELLHLVSGARQDRLKLFQARHTRLFFLDMVNRAGEKFILGAAPVTKPGSRESQRNIQNDQRQGRDLKDGCHGFAKIGHQSVLNSPQGRPLRPPKRTSSPQSFSLRERGDREAVGEGPLYAGVTSHSSAPFRVTFFDPPPWVTVHRYPLCCPPRRRFLGRRNAPCKSRSPRPPPLPASQIPSCPKQSPRDRGSRARCCQRFRAPARSCRSPGTSRKNRCRTAPRPSRRGARRAAEDRLLRSPGRSRRSASFR